MKERQQKPRGFKTGNDWVRRRSKRLQSKIEVEFIEEINPKLRNIQASTNETPGYAVRTQFKNLQRNKFSSVPKPEAGKSKRFAKQFCPFQSPAFISKRKMKIKKAISKQVVIFDLQPEADTPKAGKVTKIISKQVVEWEPTPFDPEEYFLQDTPEAENMRDYKFSMVILFELIFEFIFVGFLIYFLIF